MVDMPDVTKWKQLSTAAELLRSSNPIATKLSLFRGDITKLEVDAIVNAANSSLLGGGGVDGAIHRAAGRALFMECRELHGCRTGDAVITGSHNIRHIKKIIHTVGPQVGHTLQRKDATLLKSCYLNSLKLLVQANLRTIAFPCISTGIYNYPQEEASRMAFKTIYLWLKEDRNFKKVDRVIFCVFLQEDYFLYRNLFKRCFTVPLPPGEGSPEARTSDNSLLNTTHSDSGQESDASKSFTAEGGESSKVEKEVSPSKEDKSEIEEVTKKGSTMSKETSNLECPKEEEVSETQKAGEQQDSEAQKADEQETSEAPSRESDANEAQPKSNTNREQSKEVAMTAVSQSADMFEEEGKDDSARIDDPESQATAVMDSQGSVVMDSQGSVVMDSQAAVVTDVDDSMKVDDAEKIPQ